MSPPVYTKTGDYGWTHLGMARIQKSHPIVSLMGTLDELMAHLGMCHSLINENTKTHNPVILEQLQFAQNVLYKLSGEIHKHFRDESTTSNGPHSYDYNSWLWNYLKSFWAMAIPKESVESLCVKSNGPVIRAARTSDIVLNLENSMDAMSNSGLKPLTHFIRPVGSPSVCELHICRTVCRRAEQSFFIAKETFDMSWDGLEDYIIYLNRLSDWLFVCARYVQMQNDEPEEELTSKIVPLKTTDELD